MSPDDWMLLVVVSTGVGLVLLIVVASRFMPKGAPDAPEPTPRSPWEQLCERLGGRLAGPTEVYARVRDVELEIVKVLLGSGRDRTVAVRARAEYRLAAGPSLEVRDVGVLDAFGKLAGVEDVELGDVGFDDQFTVHGSDAAAVAAVFTPTARAIMKAMPQNRVVSSDGRAVTVLVLEPTPDAALLEQLATLTVELASYEDPGLKRLLRVLDGQLDRGTPGAEPAHVVAGGLAAQVRVGARAAGPEGALVAWCREASWPPFHARVEAGEVEGELPKTGADPSLLRALGTASIDCTDGVVSLVWASWPEADAPIRAGARFVAGFAAPPGAGAFR